ncbi:MAG: hypothetical protein HRU76_06570 [Phycisphaeraceae bacterium]|nr:hypothetical protein [Phycisphaerales bacterium]QOJ17256.1 MAG: hypothetical protein HRU76_06570 [Phycisphaeraceae bacterium]
MRRISFWLIAMLHVTIIAFCAVGFLATFEPGDSGNMWAWRIGYGVVGSGSLAAIIALLLPRLRVRPKRR